MSSRSGTIRCSVCGAVYCDCLNISFKKKLQDGTEFKIQANLNVPSLIIGGFIGFIIGGLIVHSFCSK